MRYYKFMLSFCLAAMLVTAASGATIREPAVAGTFCPANPSELHNLVDRQLSQVEQLPQVDGRLLALIVPHAGLIYSGPVAAFSYKLLEGSDIHTVILCGPDHHYGFAGISVYGPGVTWRTPLGDVPCDSALCAELIAFNPPIREIPESHAQEHSLEVQLPFLQTVLKDFKIVPVQLGYQNPQSIKLLSDALSSLKLDDQTIMIASSDWQHYHPASVGWPMDSLGMECVKALDPDRLESYLMSKQVEACGGGDIVAVLRAAIADGANHVEILKHGDSGDITGDKSSVVGYVAAAIYHVDDDPPAKQQGSVEEQAPYQLTDAEKTELLKIARRTITSYLTTGEIPDFSPPAKLQEPGAAFVTLNEHGRLRGCIGYTEALMPLYQTVTSCAISAATRDPRFRPVQAYEIDSLHIELSVLTPLQVVKSLEEIQVGRDGLMITKGSNRGLLLPQVATEYGWNREEFLEQTCVKAGLPRDAYRSPDAVIERFQALVFDEH